MKYTQPETLSDIAIKRRLLKFFRQHKIPHRQDCSIIYMGSAVVSILNGRANVYFPQMSKHYGNTMWFSIEFDDCWNFYLNLSRKHNRLISAFPMSLIQYLPDLFD